MIKPKPIKKKKIKIWWYIPNLEDIPTNEAKELIYRSLQIASDAHYHYNGKLEDPIYFRSFSVSTEANKGQQMLWYMVGKMKDPRVHYNAEIK